MGEAKRCGAKNRQGNPCQKWAMPNGRCKLHGGMSPGRPLIHGRRSKFLPAGLKELYEDLAEDSAIATLEEDIRTVEAMLLATLAEMRDKAGASWANAKELFEAGDAVGLRAVLEAGLATDAIQERFERLTIQKARLVAVESRRMALQESSLNARQANALVVAVLAAINEEQDGISAPARARIRTKLVQLMSPAADRRVE